MQLTTIQKEFIADQLANNDFDGDNEIAEHLSEQLHLPYSNLLNLITSERNDFLMGAKISTEEINFNLYF